MHISRSQSFVIALGSIMLFFAVGVVLVQYQRKPNLATLSEPERAEYSGLMQTAPAIPALGSTGTTTAPQVEQDGEKIALVLNNFERSETKHGKIIWQVHAAQGRYLPGDNRAVLSDATLSVYRNDGSKVVLKAREASLQLSGASLTEAQGFGGVTVIHEGEFTVTTEVASYNRDKSLVLAPGLVKIEASSLQISGHDLELNVETQEMTLKSDVSTFIKPKGKI